jgi:hypothetical protein
MPPPPKPVKHPLSGSFSKIINSYGLDILSVENSQRCRALLKDFEGDANINDINEVYQLLNKDIYSQLIGLKSHKHNKIFSIEEIYKHLKKINITKGQNREALELIVGLIMNKSQAVKPVNEIKKIDLINIFYRIIYYFSFLINFFRYKYKLILPALVSIAGVAVLIFLLKMQIDIPKVADLNKGLEQVSMKKLSYKTCQELPFGVLYLVRGVW